MLAKQSVSSVILSAKHNEIESLRILCTLFIFFIFPNFKAPNVKNVAFALFGVF